ncbi:MAG: putative RNA uridine N3 methyltransferase, partial [Thermofilum sp.]
QNHTTPKTLVIATSRKGTPINTLATQLKTKIATAETLLVLFGTHNKGIQEIATQENINPQHYIHYTLNTAPLQGTKTIRTEEAVLTTMAILNLLDQQTTT